MEDNTLNRDADALLGNLLRARSGAEGDDPPATAGGPNAEIQITMDPVAGDAPSASGADSLPTTVIGAPLAVQGESIGRYRLLQQVGEGGFGVVWEAEQREPVRRRVALKIIKLGMDTREVVARFEAERQALALMDHPNIARVLDGGATDTGRPYFVMEFVSGSPLTTYCDRTKLSVRERLELFIPVCQAVQHAHQKGVIHRDIKPSNILVAMLDGKAVPKIIDFGIARATGQKLTERTLFTQVGQLIGTPEYMSPEQAGLSGLDVDTRTDVYSLGVVLYELLTGHTPLDRKQLRRLGYAEIQRMVCDGEPVRPSTRISTLGANITDIAARRHIDPDRLGRALRGDLDWIVMRALEKDRTRRYETADGLALDVQRYLNNEPVAAGPPSMAYRLERFVARNRVGVAFGAGMMLVLLVATVISVWQAVVATRASALAEQRLQDIKDQQKLTVEARTRAEHAREDAEDLINFLLTDLKKGLAPIGRVDLMRGIAETVQDYYARQEEEGGSPEAMLRRGQALGVLADVVESAGRAEDADRLAQQCANTLKKWIESNGRTDEALRTLAEAHERRARFVDTPRWGRKADAALAEALLGAAVGMWQELYNKREATVEDRWRLVCAMVQQSRQLRAIEKLENGQSLLVEAARLTAIEEQRYNLPALGQLAKTFIACDAIWTGSPVASFPKSWNALLSSSNLDSLQPVRDVLRNHPDDQQLREHAWHLINWPAVTAPTFAGRNALVGFSVDLSSELKTRDSNNLLWAERAAQSLEKLAETQPPAEAAASLGKCLEILESLVRRQPWNIALQERLCVICRQRGTQLSANEPESARQHFTRALEVLGNLERELEENDGSTYAGRVKTEREQIAAALGRLKEPAPK